MRSWIVLGVVTMMALSGCSGTIGGNDGTKTQTSAITETQPSAMPQFSIETAIAVNVTVRVKELTTNETVLETTYNMQSGDEVQLRDQLEHKKYYVYVSVEGGEEREWRLGQNQGIDIRITAEKKLVVESNSAAHIDY